MPDSFCIPGAVHRERAAAKKEIACAYAALADKYKTAAKEDTARAAATHATFKMLRSLPERERDASLQHLWQSRQSDRLRARLNFAEAAAWRANETRANVQALTHTAIAAVETFAAKLGLI
jgi:hypothetical protein